MWLAVAVTVVVLAAFIPLRQRRVLSAGTDKFEAHQAVYGEQVAIQEVALRGPLTGVGAIVVNLLRTDVTPPAEVDVSALDGTALAHATVSPEAIRDDAFAWVTLDHLVRAPEPGARIVFSAPRATSHTALGVRFEEKDPAQLALGVEERVPLWQYALYEYQTVTGVRIFSWAALAGVALSLLLAVPQQGGLSRQRKRWLAGAALFVLVAGGVAARFYVLSQLKGVSGGDPYNYLAITQRLVSFENPFSEDKRLPGYPLLLVPVWLTDVDHVRAMQLFSLVSAGGVAIALALLARALNLPWGVQGLAAALLLVQKDFFFTSLRPEPYTWYALLLLVALLLWLHRRRGWRVQVLLGLTLGAAAMTRQEGFVLAAVLGAATLADAKKLGWRGLVRIALPAFVLVLPYFVHTTRAFGNPFFSPYFNPERMEIVNSWESFRENAGASWGVLSALWRPRWNAQYRVEFGAPLFLAGVFGVCLWWWMQRASVRRGLLSAAAGAVGAVLLGSVLYALRQHPDVFGEAFMRVSAGVLAGSVVPFLAATRGRGIVIVAVLLSQVLVATWFQRMPKHFQQDYPLLMLLLAAALVPAQRLAWSARTVSSLAVLVPFAAVTVMLGASVHVAIDASNRVTAADSVVYRAVRAARKLPGPHGSDFAYQPARLYFGPEAFYYTNEHDKTAPETVTAWLSQNSIRTLVTTSTTTHELPREPAWQEMVRFRAEGKQEKMMESVVYRVRE